MSLAPRLLRGLAMELSHRALDIQEEGLLNNYNTSSDRVIANNHTLFSNDETNTNHPDPFINERLGLIIFLISTITSVLLVLTMVLREYYFKRHGVDVCLLFSSQERDALDRRRQAVSNQQDADRALAEQLQRQLNEEERETERLLKRKERRKWYEYYLQPFTMTVEQKDIFYAHEMEQEKKEDNTRSDPESLEVQLRRLSSSDESEVGKEVIKVSTGSYDEEDDEEVSESAKPIASEAIEAEPVLCCEDEEDAHLYLRLPVKSKTDDKDVTEATQRHVYGQCALCIDDYEAGDQVVWSDLECPHAFHKECIMQWLSKGKKRCPICRNWFVPGARIEDQKKLHGEDWERASSSLEQNDDEPIDQETFDLEHESNNNALAADEQQSESLEIAPSSTEESDNDIFTQPAAATNSIQDSSLQCSSHPVGPQSTSGNAEVERKNYSSIALPMAKIEDCNLSEPISNTTTVVENGCCHPENNNMDISSEMEEYVCRLKDYEEV
ncbi:ring finger domain containing protein [Nitzschia inconspicua]|uniref:Ring finger domain containing protein n=1 Tax=Nitzschia inconspicua TaxID=303405 RepID=A0A9K3KB69_9STRA|nr:ring finger domain containing protein [Nitzschia inconspicua]